MSNIFNEILNIFESDFNSFIGVGVLIIILILIFKRR